MVIKYLIEKEFKQIFRNKFLPKLFVLLPTMMLLVLPWAANQEVKGLKLCIVDNDHSTISQRLSAKIAASKYFVLTAISGSNNEAMQNIEQGTADIILEIEPDFERNIINTGMGRTMISANAINGSKSAMGSAYINSIIADFSDDLQRERGSITLNTKSSALNISPYYVFNPQLDYKVFMIPAMMVMMLTLLTGFLPALNIVGEKEKGTIEQMNVTPVGKVPLILSKLIPYWIIGFAVLTYAMILAWVLYGLTPQGNVATIYLFASIYILVVSGLGLIVSNTSSTMSQALFLMFFFMIIFILMSGLFTPVTSMPQWAQLITRFNPLRYFIEVMRSVYLKGCSINELSTHLATLTTFAISTGIVAVMTYRKNK